MVTLCPRRGQVFGDSLGLYAQKGCVAWRLRAAREKLRWQHADVRADRIYNRTMLVKLVRNWRVAVDAFKRDAAIEARVAAKRAEVRGWLDQGNLGASLDGSLSESLKFLT